MASSSTLSDGQNKAVFHEILDLEDTKPAATKT